MIKLLVVLVTSFAFVTTTTLLNPCVVQYSDGTENVTDCFPAQSLSCEQVNLTTALENIKLPGSSNQPVAHEKATIIGMYVCKPRPCVDPSNLSENQTVVDCKNASASSSCVPAGQSMDWNAVVELKDSKCARPVALGHFEDLSKDPDISHRCSISPAIALAQFACRVENKNGTLLSQRECRKGTRTCNTSPSCTVTINNQDVDLYFCDNQ